MTVGQDDGHSENQHVDSDFFFETHIEYYEKLYIYIYAYECVYRIIRRYVHLI